MTSALIWCVGGQHHAPAALPSVERPGTHFTGDWVGPTGAVLDGWGKSRSPPQPGFHHRTVQLVESRYTDWAIAAPCVMRVLLGTFRKINVILSELSLETVQLCNSSARISSKPAVTRNPVKMRKITTKLTCRLWMVRERSLIPIVQLCKLRIAAIQDDSQPQI
jgi:hypothetical protein